MAKKNLPQGVTEAIVNYKKHKNASALENEKANECRDAALEFLLGSGSKSISFETDDAAYKATVVQPSSSYVDEDRLKKTLGADLWKKVTVTTRTLDQNKLANALASGVVSSRAVAECTEVRNHQPSLRVTEKGK